MTDLTVSPLAEQEQSAAPARFPLLTLVALWLGWAALIIGFQALVDWRYQPARPDYAVAWTPDFTLEDSQDDKPYLIDPFMNRQVSWDSEYYLSIAVGGYEDPLMRLIDVRDNGRRMQVSQNYAFFPLYPYLAQILSLPLRLLGLTPIATATLASVIISLLGTLAGMIALYDLSRDRLSGTGGLRAVFYLLIFPTGFFLAQVYTEGLFVGLAFSSLALIHRRRLFWAGILAALAVWTRSVGVALVIPLALAWLEHSDWRRLLASANLPQKTMGLSPLPDGKQLHWRILAFSTVGILLPLASFLLWQRTVGHPFDLIQTAFFGRGLFNWDGIQYGLDQISTAFSDPGEYSQMAVYYSLEIASVILALLACLFTLRRYPGLALFSLSVLVISVFSGAAQSLIRYVLVIPSLFIFLAALGRNIVFDRLWTILSLLLLAMQSSLFAWDMWVA